MPCLAPLPVAGTIFPGCHHPRGWPAVLDPPGGGLTEPTECWNVLQCSRLMAAQLGHTNECRAGGLTLPNHTADFLEKICHISHNAIIDSCHENKVRQSPSLHKLVPYRDVAICIQENLAISGHHSFTWLKSRCCKLKPVQASPLFTTASCHDCIIVDFCSVV